MPAVMLGMAGTAVYATTVSVWNGDANGTWSNSGNWDSNGPPSTLVGAEFDTSFSNQPTLTASATTNGIWMTTGVDQNVTISASGAYTLTLGGSTITPTLGTGSVTTDVLLNDTDGDSLTFGSNIALKFGQTNGTLNINNGDTMVVAGSIYTSNGSGPSATGDGTGTLDIAGTLVSGGGGTLTLSNITAILQQNDSNSGGITANSGTVLRLNAAGAVSSGASVGVASGATVQMRTDTSTTFTGNYSFGSSTLNIDQLTSAGINNTVTLNGNLTFGNASTFNLTSGDGYSLNSTGTIVVGNGYSSTSTLSPTGTQMTIHGNVSPLYAKSAGVNQGLNLAGNSTGNAIYGNLSDNSGAGGTLGPMTMSLQKTGTSTWLLAGQNTYSGTTAISGGILLIDGNSSGATGVTTVSSGGTLGGSGTVGGITSVASGATLAPGDGSGTLTFSQNLTMASGSTASFSGNELSAVDETLNLLNGWKLSLNSGFQNGGSVTLFTFGSAGTLNLTPTINDSNLGFTPSGSLSLSEVGDTIVLNGISSVPEPASLGLLAIGGMALLTRRRRAP